MSPSWTQRKARLLSLLGLGNDADEDAEGTALDRILHGSSVIGKTSRTREIDSVRFMDKDISVMGTLDRGQFGVIHIVTCKLNGRVYVRKLMEKSAALRFRDQCRPQFERDLLLRATRSSAQWAPHLLCAFQTETHLSLVMDYADGGSLWDVLQSSPLDGRLKESDLRWWAPQLVSAIHWCHDQGFAHRDVKPHNFVVTSSAHVLMIDFGSAAPLVPGTQSIPKKYCLVPCGTCDYISPEILIAHEDALIKLEMEMDEDEVTSVSVDADIDEDAPGYGLETDWWSLGAMLYEMAYGVAPFFAESIRHTYLRIMDHETSLRFTQTSTVSDVFQDFMRGLLKEPVARLGRRGVNDIMQHPFFSAVNWQNLRSLHPPTDLHLPVFMPVEAGTDGPSSLGQGTSLSRGFAFSGLFESSVGSGVSPSIAVLRSSHGSKRGGVPETPIQRLSRSVGKDQSASFIGFSWGPSKSAFDANTPTSTQETTDVAPSGCTPQASRHMSTDALHPSLTPDLDPVNLPPLGHTFATPLRGIPTGTQNTLPRMSTLRKRPVSDREAMKQLIDCVGMSARKKVLESGRKPRILDANFFEQPSRTNSRRISWGSTGPARLPPAISTATGSGGSSARTSVKKELRFVFDTPEDSAVGNTTRSDPSYAPPWAQTLWTSHHNREGPISASEGESETDIEAPPSPSPSPRPGSVTSFMSRRSSTPTATMTVFNMTQSRTLPSFSDASSRRRSTIASYSNNPDQEAFSSESGPRQLGDLEHRHRKLMDDIESIQQRLNSLRSR